MASSPPPSPQPTRFAVQFAKGKGWKTMYVHESPEAATQAFHEAIKVKPKGFFRLVRLDPNSQDGQDLDFTWKLLALHDPRKGGISGVAALASSTVPRPVRRPIRRPGKPRPGERVGIPFSVYVVMLGLGAALAVVLYMFLGGAGR
ncbi:conserved hypothetical protein [uncultured Gammaproteobacteria bacterium]